MKHISQLLAPAVMLLALATCPVFAQNIVLTTSTSTLPGGGAGNGNVLIGPGNTYSSFNYGYGNVFIGDASGFKNSTGHYNTATGNYAGFSNTTGKSNTFTGSGAGYLNTSGSYNIFTGYQAGVNNTEGNYNAFMGHEAGRKNTIGSYNSFVGNQAGYENLTGIENSFLGDHAGHKNTTGSNNTFMGVQAGYYNTEGIKNTFLGNKAGQSNKTGSNNAFVGHFSGGSNQTGAYNTFMGYFSGHYNTSGSSNTYLGHFANATFENQNPQRATAIGYSANVGVDDGLVLGSDDVKVGIGTSYPDQRLTIRGNINYVAYDNSMMLKGRPFLQFNEHESLALGLGAGIPDGAENTLVLGSSKTEVQLPGVASNYLANSGQVLTVNESGKVLLTQPRIRVQSTAEWADKVFEENYPLRPLAEVEAFVKKNKHLPGVPSAEAMVAVGMNSAAFNAKLLEKIEELTLYVLALEKRLKEVEKK